MSDFNDQDPGASAGIGPILASTHCRFRLPLTFPDTIRVGGPDGAQLLVPALPGSDLEYYQLTYTGEIYKPITQNWVLHFKTNLGYGDGYGDTQGLPFFENFFAGGLSSGGGTVRGFDENSLGPRSTNPAQYLTEVATWARDANGNILTYESGAPISVGSYGYQTVPVMDAAGNQVIGPDGTPQVR